MLFRSEEDKDFFSLEIDEMADVGMNIEERLADIVIDINDLTFEQIKEKIIKALINIGMIILSINLFIVFSFGFQQKQLYEKASFQSRFTICSIS